MEIAEKRSLDLDVADPVSFVEHLTANRKICQIWGIRINSLDIGERFQVTIDGR